MQPMVPVRLRLKASIAMLSLLNRASKGVDMNPDIKAQWVAALRSGEYRQGKGQLHRTTGDEHSYCCLGVLCDLAVKADVRAEVYANTSSVSACYRYDGNYDIPPLSVREWAGAPAVIELEVADEDGDVVPVEITELNDEHGYTFEQLAALIEDQL